MSAYDTQGNGKQLMQYRGSVSPAKSRRTVKTLVELTIGVVGLIGVMLAQMASSQQMINSGNANHYQQSIISEFGSDISEKVERISKVSPVVSKISLSNILF